MYFYKTESKIFQIINMPLFEHDTQIMHLSKIGQHVIAGSLFPTIKIHDTIDKKVIALLYNHFLLGPIDNTLLYARKEDKERRKTAFTRWLYADTNKKYSCTLHRLTKSFDTKNETSTHISIEIDKDNYPLTCKNSSSLIVLDQKENYIPIVKSAYQPIQSIYAEPLALKIERGNQKTIDNLQAFKKYLQGIFAGEDFANYIKSYIKHENYELFLQDPKNKLSTNHDFFYWLISKSLEKIIDNRDALEAVTGEIIKEYGSTLYSKEITGSFFKGIDLNNPSIYQTLQQHFTPDILRVISEKYFGSLFLSPRQNIKVYTPLFTEGEKAKNICANDSSLFLQTDQTVWQLDLETKKFKPIYQIKDQGNSIENIFPAENGLYMITNKEFIKIDLSK